MLINNIILKNKSIPNKENFTFLNSQNILIQIFAATMDRDYLQNVLDKLVKLAPQANYNAPRKNTQTKKQFYS